MSVSVELGRIRAVPIRGTLSLALLVGLFAGMTAWGLRSVQPGHAEVAYGVAALGCSVLFVWTVYVHEVAHVVAARLFGAKVNGVTLSFVGGETAISGQPGSPWQGVIVAAAGPVASLACAALCIGAAFGLAALGSPALIPLALAWVGALSFLLAVANLIPAAPLDGGHILHAAVWARTGNRVRASAIAGVAGQLVATGLVAWAAYLIAVGERLQPVALAVFAVPLWRGASATRRAAWQRRRLAGVLVGEVMHPPTDGTGRSRDGRRFGRRTAKPITATADEPLADVLERSHAHAVPVAVVEDETIVGVIDPTDIESRLDAPAVVSEPASAETDAWPGWHRAA